MRIYRISALAAALLLGSTIAWWMRDVIPAGGPVPLADASSVSRSIDFFESRLADDPHNYPLIGRLIDRYVQRFALTADPEDIRTATGLAVDLRRLSPDTAAALARHATVLLMQHRFALAQAAARQAVAHDSTDPDALGALFDAAMAGGDDADATWALQHLPDNALGTLVRRAQWADAAGDLLTATRTLARVCRQLEQSSRAAHLRAWCLVELGNLEYGRHGARAARARYHDALSLVPGYRAALEGLAGLAEADGRWAEAGTLYRSIATDGHPDLYLRLADVSLALGDSAAATRATGHFLRVANRPEHESLYGAMLVEYLGGLGSQTALQRAGMIARREIQRRPTRESYAALAWILYRQGRYRDALAVADSARLGGTPDATMDYHRALILRANGQTAEADSLYAVATADPRRLTPQARRHWRDQSGS